MRAATRQRANAVLTKRGAARQRNYIDFGDHAIVRFPCANTTVVQRNASGEWPLQVVCIADATPSAVMLKLNAPPKHDVLGLTRQIASREGLTGCVVRIDGVNVKKGTTPRAMYTRLRFARSFEVLSQRPATLPCKTTTSRAAAIRRFGDHHPVIGAVELLQRSSSEGNKRRIRFTLYDTPGLRKSVTVSKRGQLTIGNLHPSEVVRLRQFTMCPVRGIRVVGRRATLETLFNRKRMVRLVGQCLGRLASSIQ
jgi:hypothetical protein